MATVGIILAGGSGSRLKEVTTDKALLELKGIPMFYYSVRVFEESGLFEKVVMVHRDAQQKERMEAYLARNKMSIPIDWVLGGVRRQDSVYGGLKALEPSTEYVFIHDSARPLIRVEELVRLYGAVTQCKAATLVNTIVDTIKAVDMDSYEESGLARLSDVDRNELRAMQTPQAFSVKLIKEAYEHVFDNNLEITDEVSAAMLKGGKIALVNNPFANPKLTHFSDIAYLEFLLSKNVVYYE